jgi:hypothetical protein
VPLFPALKHSFYFGSLTTGILSRLFLFPLLLYVHMISGLVLFLCSFLNVYKRDILQYGHLKHLVYFFFSLDLLLEYIYGAYAFLSVSLFFHCLRPPPCSSSAAPLPTPLPF